MSLNEQRGNMYPFVTHTWNPIRGKCPHDCAYCYMKVYTQPELHFAENEMNTSLGQGNFIFVGSSCDMWAESVSSRWIADTLNHCIWYEDSNKYLFQSKNPHRFSEFTLPENTVLGATIETNRDYRKSLAPLAWERYQEMKYMPQPKMVSIEPIMDFDIETLVYWVADIEPEFVSIGADSKGHGLPEPPPEKVRQLIDRLKEITIVKIKDNLKRLL